MQRGISFDDLSIAELCAPISARREPEGLDWRHMGAKTVDPGDAKAANQRAVAAAKRGLARSGRQIKREREPRMAKRDFTWSEAEERQVMDLHAQGRTSREIAAIMRRSPDAIRNKINRLRGKK